jgi:hypothetical protein
MNVILGKFFLNIISDSIVEKNFPLNSKCINFLNALKCL